MYCQDLPEVSRWQCLQISLCNLNFSWFVSNHRKWGELEAVCFLCMTENTVPLFHLTKKSEGLEKGNRLTTGVSSLPI